MTTAIRSRTLVATLALSAAAAALPAGAQDFGLMARMAQAQPGAAVVLAQLRMRQAAAQAATSEATAPATRPPGAVALARPALVVTAAAATAPRPLPLVVAVAR